MTLQDALFNWLQIKIVSDARKDDQAAKDTLDFFEQILTEDHHLSEIHVLQPDETLYLIQYLQDGINKKQSFDQELAGKLLEDIISNPKYNQ